MNAPTASEAIVEKIQKLLSMTTAAGCTESEAANAALLAEKLLVQHKLSMSDVLKASFAAGEVKAVQGHGKATDKVSVSWAVTIAISVGHLCFCKPFAHPTGFAFVGFEADVAVATALMDHFMLHGTASMNAYRDKDWAKFKREKPGVRYPGLKVRGEFLNGYGLAIGARLRARLLERENAEKIAKMKAEAEAKIADEASAANPSIEAGEPAPKATTTYDLAVYSRDAIKEWENAQKAEGMRFSKKRAAPACSGKAQAAGYLAGQSAPLAAQSALA